MSSLFILIPVSLIIGLAAFLLLLWGNKKGQFDDPEGPKYRMMEDDSNQTNRQGCDEHEDNGGSKTV